MPVSITWSAASLGSAITNIDYGAVSNGAYTSAVTTYLNHDGLNSITQAGFFFQQKVTGYSGSFSGSIDFTEIKGWGDDDTVNGHGGAQVNMDPTNNTGWNVTTWDLSESTKQTSVAFTMNAGVADTSPNWILLNSNMAAGMTVDGTIPTGVEASFLTRFQVPTDEDTVGTRQIDKVLKYTFTS